MKRSRALAPLSRDHHHALVVAARLRRVTARTAKSARAGLLAYWDQQGAQHFREEEEILLPAYGRHANPNHPLIAQVLCEHVLIRALVADVRQPSPSITTLRKLGLALADHVRVEERLLFPLIEEMVPSAELERLAAQFADTNA